MLACIPQQSSTQLSYMRLMHQLNMWLIMQTVLAKKRENSERLIEAMRTKQFKTQGIKPRADIADKGKVLKEHITPKFVPCARKMRRLKLDPISKFPNSSPELKEINLAKVSKSSDWSA